MGASYEVVPVTNCVAVAKPGTCLTCGTPVLPVFLVGRGPGSIERHGPLSEWDWAIWHDADRCKALET